MFLYKKPKLILFASNAISNETLLLLSKLIYFHWSASAGNTKLVVRLLYCIVDLSKEALLILQILRLEIPLVVILFNYGIIPFDLISAASAAIYCFLLASIPMLYR